MLPLEYETFDAEYEEPTARPIKDMWTEYRAGSDIDATLPFYDPDSIAVVEVWCPTKECRSSYCRITDADRAHEDFSGVPADHDVMCSLCAHSARLEDQMEVWSVDER